MPKTITLTDPQYDWFAARARGETSMRHAIDKIIGAIDRYEKDLAKYQAWVNASTNQGEQGGF